MNKRINIAFFALFLILTNKIVSQTSIEENQIRALLTAKYGDVTNIGAIVDVNKEKNEYQQQGLPITDPYKTLKNCYLFTSKANDRGIVGIYKNNNLIWDSGPMAYDGNDHRIFGTMDLNNDGNVEILAVWDVGMQYPIQNLWIISWNGLTGTIINRRYHYWLPEDQESEIYTYDYLTDLIDVDGDGILEIKGINIENRDKIKIYSWTAVWRFWLKMA